LRVATEELCGAIENTQRGHKIKVSTDYVFEPDHTNGIIVKWEPGEEPVLQGLEPFAHMHPTFLRYAEHPAFTEPCAELLGLAPDEVALFTEKLNVKRAHFGGKYALHQDYPYWIEPAEEPENLVTVWVALDDATIENGALEVLPGSHKHGRVQGKQGGTEFEANEIDPDVFDTSGMIHVEVPAGAAIFFGPFLVHRSAPNLSDNDRRAVLYTYQRKGLRTQFENTRAWLASMNTRA
jgi:phytanoyl-CoA hydroxylase